jgi:hypothetical protein
MAAKLTKSKPTNGYNPAVKGNNNVPASKPDTRVKGQNGYRGHSGCVFYEGYTKKSTGERIEMLMITGWNYSQSRGKIKFIATERQGDKAETKSKRWVNFAVKMTHALGVTWYNGLWDKQKERLFIPDLEMVADAKSGTHGLGYFGKYYRTKDNKAQY